MEVLSIAVQKGGTGKTTTALTIAGASVKKGKKTLVIDLDPQGNLTSSTGCNPTVANAYTLITGECAPMDAITTANQGFDLISASWRLQEIVSTEGGMARRLKKAIDPLKNEYDLIVIDTPPTAGALQLNALLASTGVLVPLESNLYSRDALRQIAKTVSVVRNNNKDLEIKGAFITAYDKRSTLSRQTKEAIERECEKLGVPYLGEVRRGISVQESATVHQILFDYAPKSNPAKDFMEIYNKVFD